MRRIKLCSTEQFWAHMTMAPARSPSGTYATAFWASGQPVLGLAKILEAAIRYEGAGA